MRNLAIDPIPDTAPTEENATAPDAKSLLNYVQENPLPMLGISLLAGIVIAQIFHRHHSRK